MGKDWAPTLDVITQNLTMAFSSALAKSLARREWSDSNEVMVNRQ